MVKFLKTKEQNETNHPIKKVHRDGSGLSAGHCYSLFRCSALVPAGSWVAAGQKAFRLLEVGGTFITWGQVASWANQVDNINDRIEIRPHLTESWTYETSGLDHGGPAWGNQHEASDFTGYDPINGMTPYGGASLAQPWFEIGNYAFHEVELFMVILDEETGDYFQGASFSGEGNNWISQATWNALLDNPQAAQKKDDWWSWVFADTWTQPGYWIAKARSERCTYPNVFVESKFKQGGVNDGDLKNKAKELNLQYIASVKYWLNALTWINDVTHPNYGTWVKEGWERHSESVPFPAYKYDYDTPKICPPSCLISNVGVSGGKEYWWHTNMVRSTVEAKVTPISNFDANHNVINPTLVTTEEWVRKTYTNVLEDIDL